ncbi:zinc finger protein 30 homolog [Anopheles bellator]|uniref:zinc finger protein 30 homolog n=1 Tax=Anopheles bellator TaxID=139047 RepID=UPI0026472F4E|nr:zinc finger protein 30 homolog [Anopheles bellator]
MEEIDHTCLEKSQTFAEAAGKLELNKALAICKFCGKTFKFHAMLRQHEKIHFGVKQFECEICGRRFLHKGTLKCHLRMHTGETPYKCPHCPLAFRGQTALNCHVFRHTKMGVKCSECSKIFATNSIVKQHIKQVHSATRSHVCNICGITYKYLKSLKLHLQNHEKRVCPECDTVFSSVYAMLRHRKGHVKESTPFQCAFCNRSFKQKADLKSHDRLRGRAFQCDICCHSFNKQMFLTNHKRRVHWQQLGLEQLKIAQPKQGWNRKGVPKPKHRESTTYTDGAGIKNGSIKGSLTHSTVLDTDHIGTNFYDDELSVSRKQNVRNLTDASVTTEETTTVCELGIMDDEKNAAMKHFESAFATNETLSGRDNDVSEKLLDRSHDSPSSTLPTTSEPLTNQRDKTRRKPKTEQEPLICEMCGKRYASATTLAVHRANRHHSQRFPCDKCERSFGYRCYLEQHIRMQHQNELIVCKLCTKRFKYVQDFKVHMKHHDDDKPFKCDQCTSTFRFPSALRSHRLLHSDEWPFQCDCGKRFRFENSLRVHKRLHGGEKLFACSVCDRKFATKAPMLRHMHNVHKNGKQMSCAVCNVVFYKKVDLVVHQSKEHPNHVLVGKVSRVYSCEHCGKEFIKKSNLKTHSYIHEDIYRYSCKVCLENFKQYAGLRNHMISTHRQTKGTEKPD